MHPSLNYPPHLVGLTITNDPPPAAAIQEVKDLLTKSNQELLEAHAETLRLKEKAEYLQQLIDSYRAILSPFRNLPQDILREIFYHCLPTDRNSIMSATEAPVVLTRVCSLWRSVALTTPHIWAKIHIPIPGHPASSWRHPSYLSESALAKRWQNFSELMQLRCQVVKEWLDRSGTCPLSISLSYPTHYILSNPLEHGADDELTDPLIEILLGFASRWSDIHLWIPPPLYKKLESRLSNVVLPTLQNFTAKLHSKMVLPGPAGKIIQAPNLRKLSLDSPMLTLNYPTILPSVANQLTHLSFFTPIFDHDFFNIIKFCHSLIHCEAKLQAPWPWSHMFPPPSLLRPDVEEVDLPNLEVLKLYDVGGFSFIFRRIKIPSLKELYYKSKLRCNGNDHDSSSLLPAEPLFAILQNTGAPFRKLTIEPSTFRREDTPIWVHMVDTVSHLVIKDPHTIQNKGYMEEDILIHDLEDFDLNLLRVVNNPTPTPETPHTKIPLPNLDTLEVYGAQQFTDEEILGVLRSRIDASRRGEVSPLRKVKFQFWRQKQIDFKAEVFQYAESAGIAMELELEYPPEALVPYIGRLSPSFLLPGPSVLGEIDYH